MIFTYQDYKNNNNSNSKGVSMYDWIPNACHELKGNIDLIYWILLPLFTSFCILLEYFKFEEARPDVIRIIRRMVISVLLFVSFSECLHIIAEITEGLVQKIGGITSLQMVLDEVTQRNSKITMSWVKFKEYLIFTLNLLSYMVAYLGIFVANALINFVWAVLYIISPLMILMYVHEGTAYITTNLYKGILTVASWKILWSILAVLILKFVTVNNFSQNGDDNFLTAIMVNFFIGFSMLFIPITTRSILSDGLSNVGSHYAQLSTVTLTRTMNRFGGKLFKGGIDKTRNAGGRAYGYLKDRVVPNSNLSSSSNLNRGQKNVGERKDQNSNK
ncbi:MAG: hypothetical protein HQK51_16490 [Oligoflexia bacterium]|nr:hypothetical protein [Oligoflexia bacterium]